MTLLRPATAADLPALTAIVDAAYGPYIPRIGRKPGPMTEDYTALVAQGVVQVLEDQGRVCGLAGADRAARCPAAGQYRHRA